jgi:hypothetical protein
MDWGLCERLPTSLWELLDLSQYHRKKMFLREKLMLPSITFYYVCIVIDLILRFFWVLSLVPATTLGVLDLVGPQLSFFLGAVEIIRRSMWGIVRVEWEHIKLFNQQTPGFLKNEVLRIKELHALIDASKHTDENDREEPLLISSSSAKAIPGAGAAIAIDSVKSQPAQPFGRLDERGSGRGVIGGIAMSSKKGGMATYSTTIISSANDSDATTETDVPLAGETNKYSPLSVTMNPIINNLTAYN